MTPEFKENLQELVNVIKERHELKNGEFDLTTPTKELALFAEATTLMEIVEPELREYLAMDDNEKGHFKVRGDMLSYIDRSMNVEYLLESIFL